MVGIIDLSFHSTNGDRDIKVLEPQWCLLYITAHLCHFKIIYDPSFRYHLILLCEHIIIIHF